MSMKPLKPLDPFRYMRYAKWAEYAPGHFLAGSAVEMPSHEEAGFLPEDFDLACLCHNYGDPRAIEAICARYGVKPGNVVLAGGSSEANTLIHLALLEPGDDVLYESPGYEAFKRLPQIAHTSSRAFPRREERGFLPDPAELARLLAPHTRLVVLTNLHNPTMTRMPEALICELAAVAAKHGAWLLVDEVYLDHLEPGTHRPSCFGLGANIIVTMSLTKVYGLGPLRFGWCLAPEEIASRLLDLVDITTVETPGIAQNLGTRALLNLDRLRKRSRERFLRGWPIVEAWAKSTPGVTLYTPPGGPLGGITAAVRIDGMESPGERSQADGSGRANDIATHDGGGKRDTWTLAEYLKHEHRVVVAPGDAFGMPGWLRINIAAEPEPLRAALAALAKGLAAWQQSGK